MGVRVLAAIAVTLNESQSVRNYAWCLARRERLGKQSWLASVLQPLAGSEPGKAAVAVFIRAVGPPPDAILALERGPARLLDHLTTDLCHHRVRAWQRDSQTDSKKGITRRPSTHQFRSNSRFGKRPRRGSLQGNS